MAAWQRVEGGLPDDVRRCLFDRDLVAVAWVPERYMMAVLDAVFAGPAARDDRAYRAIVDRIADLNFGRSRRELLDGSSPQALLGKASELWRHEHTRGELTVALTGTSARILLRDHDYLTTRLGRVLVAEAFRYIVSLTRVESVAEEHAELAGGVFRVDLRWEQGVVSPEPGSEAPTAG